MIIKKLKNIILTNISGNYAVLFALLLKFFLLYFVCGLYQSKKVSLISAVICTVFVSLFAKPNNGPNLRSMTTI